MRRVNKFSLIELLVVISVIVILMSILLPVLKKAKQRSKEIYCMNNQKQTAISMVLYEADYNGFLPKSYYNYCSSGYAYNWGALLMDYKYVKSFDSINCPSIPNAKGEDKPRYSYGMRKDIAGHKTNLENINMATIFKKALLPQKGPSTYPVGACSAQSGPGIGSTEWGGRYQEGFSLDEQFGNAYDSLVYRVHNNRANVWFLDGHVANLNDQGLKGLIDRGVGIENNNIIDQKDDDFENSWNCYYY